VSVPEHLFGRRSHEHSLEFRLAASAEYNQINVIDLRAMDDLLNGMAHSNIGL
jgi:hypothetical protein